MATRVPLVRSADGNIEELPGGDTILTSAASVIRWDTFAGYGGTDTQIPYFTNKNTDTSSGEITIVNNSTNGLRLTINTAGTYAITFSGTADSATVMGLSLNSNQLTTSIASITELHRLAMSDGTACFCAYTGPLAVNDVIRPHAAAVGTGSLQARWAFSICKIG
jgi:hypothetical protein